MNQPTPNTGPRTVSWFSCGAASAIATKITLGNSNQGQNIVIAYCETGAEHPDNARFMADCEKWFGMPITSLKSDKYEDTWDVWEKRKYISGIKGAPCTKYLKIEPRIHFQRPDDIHVFGYTADGPDITRANNLREHWPDLNVSTPLIDGGITKAATIAMLTRAGVAVPVTYAMGFPNANCMPCCKATSPAYWALVRECAPDQFNRMAELSRRLGARLARVDGERVFIDEVPADQSKTQPIAPECDFLCSIAEQDFG